MKKITILLLAAVFSITLNAGIIYVPGNSTDNEKAGKTTAVNVFSQLDAKTFLSLTPAQVQEMTGKKMTIGQKISLKMAQLEVKKQLRKGKEIKMAEMGKRAASGISAIWLIAGFFLGLIGVLIAYLTREDSDDNRVKSAWIGFGIGLVLYIVFLVIFWGRWFGAVNAANTI